MMIEHIYTYARAYASRYAGISNRYSQGQNGHEEQSSARSKAGQKKATSPRKRTQKADGVAKKRKKNISAQQTEYKEDKEQNPNKKQKKLPRNACYFKNLLYLCRALDICRRTSERQESLLRIDVICGSSSVGRAQPCQGWGRGSESRLPLFVVSVVRRLYSFEEGFLSRNHSSYQQSGENPFFYSHSAAQAAPTSSAQPNSQSNTAEPARRNLQTAREATIAVRYLTDCFPSPPFPRYP